MRQLQLSSTPAFFSAVGLLLAKLLSAKLLLSAVLLLSTVLSLGSPAFAIQQDSGKKTAPAKSEKLTQENTQSALTPQEQIKAEMKRIAIECKLPSMFAGYQTLGNPLVASSGGTRKSKSGVKVSLDDKIHLGSCTKAMTATMIGRLIERGKLKHGTLRWDITIEEALPELVKDLDPVYANVTLRQLLMHRGGCPTFTNWVGVSQKSTLTETRRSLVRMGLKKKHDIAPGEFQYSNLGYVVAGLMAARATGKPWEQLMREEIFDPLGLKSAGFGPPGKSGKIEQPWGHKSVGTLQIPLQADNPPALGPAGTVHMSMADWSKFCLSHTLQADDKSEAAKKLRLVSQETLEVLHQPPSGKTDDGKSYALGWRALERNWGGRVYTHSGSNTMWLCTVWVSPKNKSVYLAATNVANEEAGMGLNQVYGTLIRLEKEARGEKQDSDD